jgi:hypothetical protein
VTVNTAATTVTIYDGTSASPPAREIAVIGTATGPFEYGVKLTQGLFIVTTGSGTDLTVVVDSGDTASQVASAP